MNPTYQDLREWLETFSPEQLKMIVTIYDDYDYHPIGSLSFNEGEFASDTLDLGHPYLSIQP